VAYEPNSLAGGCPFQAGKAGFSSFPAPREGDKVRGKPEKFGEHYNQATLFWESQSDIEKRHIIGAYRFELTKVQVTAVRERVVSQLRNVSEVLAKAVADGLGMELPEAMPKALARTPKAEVKSSPALSLLARPGAEGIKTRRIAILVADGVDGEAATAIHEGLVAKGAVPRFVGIKLGAVAGKSGDSLEVEVSLETAPAVVWDAMIVPDGEAATRALSQSGHAKEFLKDQYRHCKPILLMGSAAARLEATGIPPTLLSGDADRGLLRQDAGDTDGALRAFAASLTQHRHFARETDPPRV
jgi:catalase